MVGVRATPKGPRGAPYQFRYLLGNKNVLADDLTKITFYTTSKLNVRKLACRRSQSLLLNSISKFFDEYSFRRSKKHSSENFPEGIPPNVARFSQPSSPNIFLVQTFFKYETSLGTGYVGFDVLDTPLISPIKTLL